jgi:AcrR family transcriptional regulator
VARAERDGDTERRILVAARTVFVRRGTAGARMQEIAEEAGVNQALLHYYFRSKDRLAEAVFREAAGRLIPSVVAVLGSAEPLETKVERFVHLYIDTVRQHPYIPGYVLAEMHHHPERVTGLLADFAGGPPGHLAAPLLQRLGAQLDAAAAAGAMRPMRAEQFLVNLLALCVFPFVARPLLGALLGLDDAGFARFLDQRRAELPRFILDALRP